MTHNYPVEFIVRRGSLRNWNVIAKYAVTGGEYHCCGPFPSEEFALRARDSVTQYYRNGYDDGFDMGTSAYRSTA